MPSIIPVRNHVFRGPQIQVTDDDRGLKVRLLFFSGHEDMGHLPQLGVDRVPQGVQGPGIAGLGVMEQSRDITAGGQSRVLKSTCVFGKPLRGEFQ